jgi:uncharacterized membrane protein YfcA
MTSILLCFFAFLAGFIDSIVGGGGLIQTPALLINLPNMSIPALLGTGKIPSVLGSGTAAIQYAQKVSFHKTFLLITSVLTMLFSILGARMVSHLDPQKLKPLMLFILIAVAIYTFWKKDFGSFETKTVSKTNALIYGSLIGSIVGFYDGFFGPGTGSFLVLAFISLMGFDFLTASAHAKVVNVASNVGAIGVFWMNDHVLWQYALPMAVFNIAGAVVGTRMAILKGNLFVRNIFLVVIIGMILRYGYDVLK